MKNLLRSVVLSSVLCLMSFVSHAQWVSIPDTNFGTWLNTNNYSQCLQGNSTVGWQMDTTCDAVIHAAIVGVSGQNIHDLFGIQYFDELTSLLCAHNNLTFLPPLPKTLYYLDYRSNNITSFPTLSDSLLYLYCLSNNISLLPSLPSGLIDFNCSNNHLTTLPPLPNNLRWLSCSENLLHTLPTLPNSIEYLTVWGNPLGNSLQLPPHLIDLYCGYDSLTVLPSLPITLRFLRCDGNQLSQLPPLPDSLYYLNCIGNQLTSLPVLPDSLRVLDCVGNNLTTLPSLPNHLYFIVADYNQLSSLPDLPDSLTSFYCRDNPNLFCLPRLKKIREFYFTNTGITCLPNYPQSNTLSIPSLNTVPLCDIFNIHSCEVYWNISGKVYIDSNANCLNDVGDRAFSNFKVQLYQNGIMQQLQNTLEDGSYSFVTGLGTYAYSLDTANFPFVLACPDSGYYTSVISALDSFDTDMDFGLHCKPGFDLVAQSISAIRFRPANVTTINISAGDATNFYNAHCAAGTSGSVQLIINGAAHYASAASGALIPTSIVNDTITWSIADFGAVNFFTAFNINVATDTTAVLGSQICFTLTVNPIAGDNNPANNILTHCFTVVGSFDPNEKEVYPAGNIDTATHWLTYTIHFQNTGTAEAQHIYLTDTLDSNIDAASFQLLAYSHQPMVQLKGNNLRFNFTNINLPDSNTNEAASHSYVQYKVKLKDNLPLGTNITNTAFIYFDFNSPVVTNTTSNTIALATSVANLGIRNADFGLNPNPATESVRISIDESMIGSNLTITDLTGREVLHSAVQIRNPQFDIRNLSPGVYFVTLENKTGRVTKKLVKQ